MVYEQKEIGSEIPSVQQFLTCSIMRGDNFYGVAMKR
jgi:hypothetical protein